MGAACRDRPAARRRRRGSTSRRSSAAGSCRCGQFVRRFRQLLRARGARSLFDEAVEGLDRLAQAAAFLAVLELYKRGEACAPTRPSVFGPIRVDQDAAHRAHRRSAAERPGMSASSPTPSRRCSSSRPSRSRCASWRRSRRPRRSASSGRSTRSPTATARAAPASCSSGSPAATASAPRRRPPPRAHGSSTGAQARALSQAALETLAVVAYLGPVVAARDRPYPRRLGRLGRGRAARARADRGGRPRRRRSASRCSTARRHLFDRMFGLEEGLDDASPAWATSIWPDEPITRRCGRRLHVVADQRAGHGLTGTWRPRAWARAGRSRSSSRAGRVTVERHAAASWRPCRQPTPTTVRVDGRRVVVQPEHGTSCCTSRPGSSPPRSDPQRPADGRRAGRRPRAAVPGRPARPRHDRRAGPHERRASSPTGSCTRATACRRPTIATVAVDHARR